MKTNRVCFRWSSSFSLFFALLPLLTTASLSAATNDLTSLLQRGLFEEEANRNPAAAIASYQSLAAQFDKDREIAATAIFRLGECYRKLGRTNDAAAQYERIVREFSDQNTLVTLSRQNLTGLGAATQAASAKGSDGVVRSLETEAALLKVRVDQLKKLGSSQQRVAVQQSFSNPVLVKLSQDLADARQKYVTLEKNFTDDRPEMVNQRRLIQMIQEQIDGEVENVVSGLQIEADMALEAANNLRAKAGGQSQETAGSEAAPTDEEQQEIRRIQGMIQNSPDLINAPDASGDTPLIRAAAKGQIVVARYLLDHGAGANVSGRNANTGAPLSEAVRNGHKAMVELLIARGADVNAKVGNRTPLGDAVSQGFPGVVDVLLANNADVNQRAGIRNLTALHTAAGKNNVSLTKLLIARNADINARSDLGETPLMAALANRADEIPSILIAAGADMRATNNNGRTALHMAVETGQTNMVLALLAAGADIAAKNNNGETPLHEATSSQPNSRANQLQLDVASILIKHGAPVNATNLQGTTPLLQAVGNGNVRFVKLLLDHKADPNSYGFATVSANSSSTSWAGYPVVFALATKNDETLKLLLEHGADPEAPAPPGRQPGPRPLTEAIKARQSAAVQLLLRHKADPNRADSGVLPLAQAIAFDAPDIVRLLLEAKADPNAQGQFGEPLLNRARYQTPGEANPNAQTQSGESLLNYALNQTRGEAIPTLLLAYGADVNVRDPHGNVPLHHAVYLAKKDAVSLLISSNANVNAQNQRGLSPLDVATSALGGTMMQGSLLFPSSNTIKPVHKSTMQDIVAILREHGARTDLPRFDRIEVRRPSANVSQISFQKGAEDWNQFSLLEVIARTYGFIEAGRAGYPVDAVNAPGWSGNPFRFPDFKRVMIHRPTADGKNWKSIPVDVAAILESGDCSRDVWLQWGDVVEIPEADHPISDSWTSLNSKEASGLVKCISRSVNIVVQGTSTETQLGPRYTMTGGGWISSLQAASFMVRSVLDTSRLIRFSSDLSRVKVTRPDPAKGKPREWIVNCTDPDRSPDLWLRNGDVVEIPEK